MDALQADGYCIVRSVFNTYQLTALQSEADAVAEKAGSVCVRHLRDKSQVFRELPFSDVFSDLVPSGFEPVRSILFDKTVDENWPVAWHQDLTITVTDKKHVEGYGPWSVKESTVHVQPPVELLSNMLTVRIHLDDTFCANGALCVIPKSHRLGRIPSKEIAFHVDVSQEVICECAAGDVVLMSPLLLHSSKRSEISSRRRVLHFEFAIRSELAPELDWFESSDCSLSTN